MNLSVPFTEKTKALQWFQKNSLRFTIRSTTYSLILKDEKHKVCVSDSAIGFKILGLISRVRSEAKKALTGIPETDKSVMYASKPVPNLNRVLVYEHDKSAAYARAAQRAGIISQKTFLDIMSIQKPFRLAVLGSLATRSVIETFEYGKRVSIVPQERETRRAWLYIVKEVSSEMQFYFHQEVTVFAFWVDALFAFTPLRLDPTFKQKEIILSIRNDNGLRLFAGEKQHLYLPSTHSQRAQI